jgi:hypothetical protein
MKTKDYPSEFSEEEIARRRDEAIRRAMNTPPHPRTGGSDSKGQKKRTVGKGRARVGKARA